MKKDIQTKDRLRKCEKCGRKFYWVRKWQKYCSAVCRWENWEKNNPRIKLADFKKVIPLILLFFLLSCQPAFCDEYGTASWYSVESCQREFGENWDGLTASGEVFDENKFTCASWDYAFGTKLRIRNTENNKSVIVIVTDRGPTKRLYKKGRIIDLSKRAFSEIASLKQGIIQIKVEKL